MKKLLFLFLIICNICKANHNYTLKDTTVIHQISFSKSGNPAYDYSREELDKQISDIMKNAGVIGDSSPSPRIVSRASLVEKLGATSPRVLCALLHKFDPTDLKGSPPPVYGDFYVFVDECHRTQGGDMNRQMKRWLPNAIFIGFTGTPLLIKEGVCSGEYRNMYWKINDCENKIYYIMHIKDNIYTKISNRNK